MMKRPFFVLSTEPRNVVGMLLAVLTVGCFGGKPPRLQPPKLDPMACAASAISRLDANQDQQISRTECEQSPSLLSAFDRYDRHPKDNNISSDEISSRLSAMLDTRLGQMPCYCEITLDGRPLADANVRLIPDPMFGDHLTVAEGTTNHRGLVRPQVLGAEPGTPGVNFGLYQVEISHAETTIPDRYNTATTLGMEVSPIERDSDHATFAIKSKPSGK